MNLICPGIHPHSETDNFVQDLTIKGVKREKLLILPTENYPPISALHIFSFLQQNHPQQPLTIISFSAGVVGAIGAAWLWQKWGGEIRTFIALDGWGMPLFGNFSIYSLSHDYFTYSTWGKFNSNAGSFYANPPVEHLQLWRSPKNVRGYFINANGKTELTTAINLIVSLL
jgi:hypothetical protein